tara:strand:- start:143 stop:469 length:327 start_codon:yes stop_codon:yes gene_type:complete
MGGQGWRQKATKQARLANRVWESRFKKYVDMWENNPNASDDRQIFVNKYYIIKNATKEMGGVKANIIWSAFYDIMTEYGENMDGIIGFFTGKVGRGDDGSYYYKGDLY